MPCRSYLEIGSKKSRKTENRTVKIPLLLPFFGFLKILALLATKDCVEKGQKICYEDQKIININEINSIIITERSKLRGCNLIANTKKVEKSRAIFIFHFTRINEHSIDKYFRQKQALMRSDNLRLNRSNDTHMHNINEINSIINLNQILNAIKQLVLKIH